MIIRPLPPAFDGTWLVAHRGVHGLPRGYPENSAGAILQGSELGMPVELDVRLAADGVPVVFHDATLDRMTDVDGRLAARTSADLARIPLRGSSPDGPIETIPTLAGVLGSCPGPLVIELKSDRSHDPELVAAVLDVLSTQPGWIDRVVLQSFSLPVMEDLATRAPDSFRCLLVRPGTWRTPAGICRFVARDARRIDAHMLGLHRSLIGARRVRRLREGAGLRVLGWTARHARDLRAARRWGIDLMASDHIPGGPVEDGP